MKSYSQNGEDLELIRRYSLGTHLPKTYIELGALDGIRYSNTKLLEEQFGWSGILIEPNKAAFSLLQVNRPGNYLSSQLISSTTRDIMFESFYNIDLAAVSSVSHTRPKHITDNYYTKSRDNDWLNHEIDSIVCESLSPVPLSAICDASGIKEFGLLSLDVEGHEYDVLCSHDWTIPVSILLVEDNGDQRVNDLILSKGYVRDRPIANNAVFFLPSRIHSH